MKITDVTLLLFYFPILKEVEIIFHIRDIFTLERFQGYKAAGKVTSNVSPLFDF